MCLHVRPFADSDASEAAVLAADVFRFAYQECFQDANRFNDYLIETFAPEAFLGQMRSDNVLCLLGYVENELAGLLKLAVSAQPSTVRGASCVELAKLYVRERFHGTGIARALLDAAMRSAASQRFDVMWLCVWERNPRAQAFYRKAGFEVVSDIVIPMDGVPFRDLVMRARIARAR